MDPKNGLRAPQNYGEIVSDGFHVVHSLREWKAEDHYKMGRFFVRSSMRKTTPWFAGTVLFELRLVKREEVYHLWDVCGIYIFLRSIDESQPENWAPPTAAEKCQVVGQISLAL
ncbi:MAG: hypothetical protein GY820_35890 [Gammaproteobacteria bacterium]|nr:hypothetical protein [Gammaproteobacteria bacterium]